MRTIARETIFKLIFSSQFSSEVDAELKSALYKAEKLQPDDIKYCDKVLNILEGHKDEFNRILDNHSLTFPEKRVFPADKAILYIALSEILYMPDIPDKVSLNEAANIASKYSSAKSASYVTGVLSSVIGEKHV